MSLLLRIDPSSSENPPSAAESCKAHHSQGTAQPLETHLEESDELTSPQRASRNQVNRSPATTATFGEGQDFIPFGFTDEEPEENSKVRPERERADNREKGKGKERELSPSGTYHVGATSSTPHTPPRDRSKELNRKERTTGDNGDRAMEREKNRERSKTRERNRDREKDRDRGKDSNRERGKSRNQGKDGNWEYDRDRDQEGGEGADPKRTKRKYEMLFDTNDGYVNKKQRTDAASRRCPWATGLDFDRCHHVAEMLHNEVKAFVNWISPTPIEDEVRGLVISLISKAVTSTFPDASVLPFGSYETKLYLPLGDIDLVILSKSMAYNDKVTVLHTLANTLKRAGITSRVTIIAKAKVPIIKFVTTYGRFNVDISINQENGIVSGNIINGFLKDMHGSGMALRSLVMITKAFLSQRSMNEVFTGGLGSYSIVCLAVSFLQMHPKIRRGEIDAEENLGVLVMEFFELYGCYFNYEEVGISVRDGGTYFSKKQRGWHDYYKGNLLSVEDPADPSNDISRGSYGFPKVRATFAGAHGILTAAAYFHAGIIASRRQGRSVHLGSRKELEEMSILSSIMGITQETLNHRKLVQDVYDKRVLHNLLGIKPQSVTVDESNIKSRGIAKNGSGTREADSVKLAWQEAEIHPEENHYKRHRDHDPTEDDEGRYNIYRRPKKRQKAGRREDLNTVFITDDDDNLNSADDNSLDNQDEEVDHTSGGGSKDAGKTEQRRLYWLSKGIGIEDIGSS